MASFISKLLEIVLSPVGVTVLSELQATSTPPQIDILLLRRTGVHWTSSQMALLPDGVRDCQARHHLLECKFTESISEESFQQALTYDYLYRQSQQLSPADLQTYVLSAQTPRRVHLEAWGYQCKEHPGVYVSSLPLLKRIILLVLNELRDAPHNDFIRLFASRSKVREAALQTLLEQPWAKWSAEFWKLLLGLQKLYKLTGANMRKELTVEDVMEIGEEVRKQVIASAAPEERLLGLAPEERLAGLAPKELEKLMRQLQTYLGQSAKPVSTGTEAAITIQRQTLIHVLQHKFGQLPQLVLDQIGTTTDHDQLTQWLDSALDAKALTEIDFGQ